LPLFFNKLNKSVTIPARAGSLPSEKTSKVQEVKITLSRGVGKMKKFNISHPRTGQEGRKKSLNRCLSILTILALALGSLVSAGCLAAPAIMLTSAAVTATALVTEGERAIQNPEMEGSYIARSETDAGPGSVKKCEPTEPRRTLSEGEQIGAKEHHEGWNQCAADRHESARAPDSTVPQT
jgi:hypothetical protein